MLSPILKGSKQVLFALLIRKFGTPFQFLDIRREGDSTIEQDQYHLEIDNGNSKNINTIQ